MSIYAIGDLHLSFGTEKPMNIFGDNWQNYEEKLENNWNKIINENDVVLIPGDFSWATYLEDTLQDFKYLNKLNGKKILLKGNHDYWWTTLKSMREFLNQNEIFNIDFIFNTSIETDDAIIVGTRGWAFYDTENSEKMLNREKFRLELSIKDGIQKNNNKKIICMMHYPPILKNMINKNEKSEYIEIMKKYNVKECIYGHLHGNSHLEAVEGNVDGVNLKLVSSDYLQFKPLKIC